MARTPFKLKSSPTKGKLDDFFKNLGENLKRNKKDIGDEMAKKYGTGDYASGGSKAKERMRAGESKFQYDIRRKREDRKTYDRETRRRENDPLLGEIKDTSELEVGEGIISGPKEKPVVPEITKPLPTYKEAYKTSSAKPEFKKRFPTFASFKTAAEIWNKENKK